MTYKDINGEICLVTGATSGIGREAAHMLASMGARVLIVGRNAEKAKGVASSISQSSGNTHVDYLVADLSKQQDIYSLARAVKSRVDHLDLLINCAGALFTHRKVSVDGNEMTLALNHLSPFLLTHLLLDLLQSSHQARVVNVSSSAHRLGSIDFNDIQFEENYNGLIAYGRSKLANLYFTYELSRRLNGGTISVNAVHPGLVATNFGKNNRGVFGVMLKFYPLVAVTPQQGAESVVYVACSADTAGVSGRYFSRTRDVVSSRASYRQADAFKMWEISTSLVGLNGKFKGSVK